MIDLSFNSKETGYALIGKARGAWLLGIGCKKLRAFSKKEKVKFELVLLDKKIQQEIIKKELSIIKF